MIYVVLINWNGWKETKDCLVSLFRMEGMEFRVVVCDNGSQDGSLDNLRTWLNSEPINGIRFSNSLEQAPSGKEEVIQYAILDRNTALAGSQNVDAKLVLVNCGRNQGFADGNNTAIRFAQSQGDMNWVWLLNNDTVVEPKALEALWVKGESDPKYGMVGSTVYQEGPTRKVDALGGARYFPWLGIPMHIGRYRVLPGPPSEKSVEKKMDYVLGASMFCRAEFIEQTGLMSNDYFLYYEELDWALRAGGAWKMGYASDSVVYHKKGASAGSSHTFLNRSIAADFYLLRNRLKITRRYFHRLEWSVRIMLWIELVLRLLCGKMRKVETVWRILRGEDEPPVSRKSVTGPLERTP